MNAILSGDVTPLNSSGAVLPVQRAQRSGVIPVLIPPGQTIPIAVAGTSFYVLQTSYALNIRVSGGVFNTYYGGTGEQYTDAQPFSGLEINNPSSVTISALIFVGFSTFIDKRLYLTANNIPQVTYPTFPIANAAANVNINDLSGTEFVDINGGNWYAVSRVSIIVSNMDTGVTYILQKAGSIISGGAGIAGIFPQTSLNYPASGNYCLNVGGANINCIVSEIYMAIPGT